MIASMFRRRRRVSVRSPSVAAVANAWYALLETKQTKTGSNWSLQDCRRVIDEQLLPALGDRSIGSITRSEVEKLHDELEDAEKDSDRFLWVASEIFRHAESEGLRPRGTNPCIYVKPQRE